VCEPDALVNTPLSRRVLSATPSVKDNETPMATVGQLIVEADRVDDDIRKAAEAVFRLCCERVGGSALSSDDFRQLAEGMCANNCVFGPLAVEKLAFVCFRLPARCAGIHRVDVSKTKAQNVWEFACNLPSAQSCSHWFWRCRTASITNHSCHA
jgi:hypothetical protein